MRGWEYSSQRRFLIDCYIFQIIDQIPHACIDHIFIYLAFFIMYWSNVSPTSVGKCSGAMARTVCNQCSGLYGGEVGQDEEKELCPLPNKGLGLESRYFSNLKTWEVYLF